MIDARHLVLSPREIWIPGFATDLTTQWKPFAVPREAKMLFLTVVGDGGSGATPTINASGGGGGGTGGLSHIILPAKALPAVLHVSVGIGGLNEGTTGSGIGTYVSCVPSTNDEDVVLYANPGTGGFQNGNGGTAAAIATLANSDLSSLGQSQFYAGIIGAAGSTTNGVAVAAIVSLPMSPGAGGGGSTGGTGGNQTSSSALWPTLSGGASGDNPGADGIFLPYPWLSIGGCGGGGYVGVGDGANKGGKGGGYGSGGGGGGNALSVTPGNGGDGAPGLLIIRWW